MIGNWTRPRSTLSPARLAALWLALTCLLLARGGAAADAPAVPAPAWVGVTGVLPPPGEPIRDRMIVIFDHAITPPKTAGGQTSAPLSAPPLTGQYEYGPNYFTFKPDFLPENTLFRATLNPALRSAEGLEVNPANRVLPITVTRFAPLNPWTIEVKPDRLVLGLDLHFEVDPAQLREHMTATDADGKSVAFEILRGTGPRILRLEFNRLAGVKWPMAVKITAGLAEKQGLLKLDRDYTFDYGRPPQKTMAVEDSSWGAVNDKLQEIRLGFSESVAPRQVAAHVKVIDLATTMPAELAVAGVRLDPESDEKGCFVSFSAPDPYDVKVRIQVTGGLQSKANAPLKAPYSRNLAVRTDLTVESAEINSETREGPFLAFTLNREIELAELTKFVTLYPKVEGMKLEHPENQQYIVRGNWPTGTRFELMVRPGLRFNGWATLRKPAGRTFETPKRFPSFLAIPFEGKYYFPRSASPALPLETRNVTRAQLTLHRMFPSNIALATANINEGNGDYVFINKWSERVAEKSIDVVTSGGKLSRTPIALAGLLPQGMRGVFMLEVVDTTPQVKSEDGAEGESGDEGGSARYYRGYRGRYYRGDRANKIILLTHIGALAHWTDGELTLFAHDLYSLAPMAGAKVSIYTSKNQKCGEGWTGADGMLQLKNFVTTLGAPHLAVIEKEDDFTFLELSSREEQNLPYTSEMPAYDRERYDAYIYADRALYRPGETVHLRWLGRKNYGDALTSMPLTLKVIKPNGKALVDRPEVLSQWGTGELDLATQKAYPTGHYDVQLFVPGESEPLASYGFQLEEFVPNRLKATVEIPDKPWIGADKPHAVEIIGKHLFGAPAEGRKAAARVLFGRGWTPAKWPGYRFDNDTSVRFDPLDLGEETTDKDGKATFEVNWKMPQQVSFPVTVTALGSVFESGGRKVGGRATTTLFPADVLLGIKGEPGEKAGEIAIEVAAVKPDESPADAGEVEVTLEKQVWSYSVRAYTTYQEPTWTGEYQAVTTNKVTLKDGLGATSFSAPEYGYYRVRVAKAGIAMNSTLLFYSMGGRCQVTETVEPSLVHLKLDKALYKVGETAELRVEAPFDGKAVIVIQSETIRRMLTAEVKGGIGTARFLVTNEDFPNAWLETTVVHAVDRTKKQVYPFASFQMAELKVEDPERRVNIALGGLPKEVTPAAPLTLEVQTTEVSGRPVETEVTLAAVDEGIHSIKGYTNPDPYTWFSRSRRPDYRRAFYYDKVAYDFDQPSPGGDGDANASLGRPAANWIRTVALWSGVVHTDAAGKAKITLNVPEFNGELRLVAVAAGKRSSGVFGGSLLVRRPWMMQTSMPRFVLPGDKAVCRATLYNLSDQPCRVALTWSHGGLLAGGEGKRDLEIKAHGEAEALAEFTAGEAVGQGEIFWRAEVSDPATSKTLVKLEEDDPIPVAEPAAYQRREDLVVLKPGKSVTVKNTYYLDDELTRLALTASAQPLLRLQNALRNVVEYPYGCVEQTTSKLLPLYLLRKSRGIVESTLKDARELDSTINYGIDRLFTMQTAEGGLAFWPGGTQPYPYGSVYALHALTLIRNGREYEVPESGFLALQRYVRGIAEQWGDSSPSSLYQRAYAVYVLALGGDKKALDTIERFDALTLPRPGRYLLAAALARNTQDRDRVRMYLASTPTAPWTVREADGTLASDVRNQAVELMALGQMNADRTQMEPLATRLTRYIENPGWRGTTQEYAFVTAALCDYLQAAAPNIAQASATILQDGKQSKITGGEVFTGKHQGPRGSFIVRNTGRADLYLSVATRGVPAKAQTVEVKDGMAARRRFYTRDGQRIDPTSTTAFKQGESYVVEVELYAERDAKNVVVADLLPAGLEVENPRLNKDDMAGLKLAHPSEAPSHLEIRDERVVLFYDRLDACAQDKPNYNHHFYYVANAVTPGQFTYPAVTAECMYDPAVRGASVAKGLKVESR